MKFLFTDEEFNDAKTSSFLPCECYNCGASFKRKKSEINHELKYKRGRVKFCSIKCTGEFLHPSLKLEINCKQCEKVFIISNSELTKNNFCSRSCSAIFNNKKRYGERPPKINNKDVVMNDKKTKLESFKDRFIIKNNNSNSKAKGEVSEALIIGKLVSLGYSVSIPFGNNQRYDLILDNGGDLIKVQCKTGNLSRGCMTFPACSTNGFTGKRKNYREDVDVFAVYCQELDKYYLVPVDIAGISYGHLRYLKTKHTSNMVNVNWAKDYEI